MTKVPIKKANDKVPEMQAKYNPEKRESTLCSLCVEATTSLHIFLLETQNIDASQLILFLLFNKHNCAKFTSVANFLSYRVWNQVSPDPFCYTKI